MKKSLLFLFVLVLLQAIASARPHRLLVFGTSLYQQMSWVLNGTVTNENGEPLPSVSVSVIPSQRGAATDIEGKFMIEITNENDSLVFSSVGFKTKTIRAGNARTIVVKLETDEDQSKLGAVVIVGYGSQKRISVTGSVSSISVKEIQRASTPALSNAIAGKLPGIITRQSSGEPGYDAAQVYIRGLSTPGNNSPLILIDGVERNMDQLNAQEIESFTILKDASATAVYGVRGANGVILINTKRGTLGKPHITFRSEVAGLHALRLPKYIDGMQYASLMNEARVNSGAPVRWSPEELQKFEDGSDPYFYPNTNWTDAVLKTNTTQSINNLSISGGTDIIKYYTNIGYTLQEGIYKQDPTNKFNTNAKVRRYNFRSNVDLQLAKSLTMQLGIGGIIQNGNYPGFGAPDIFQSLRTISPIDYPVTNPDGTPGASATASFVGWNPWGRVTQSGYTTQDRSTLQATFSTRWDISSFTTKGLSLRGLFSYDRYSETHNLRIKEFEVKRYLGKDPVTKEDRYSAPYREEKPLGYGILNFGNRAIYMEAQLNYARSFGLHSVTSMLLYNQRDYVNLNAPASILNLPYRRQGFAGRATYDYDNRYLAEINIGYNGSENFPKGKRFGFFPAFSAGWVISNENFWNVPVISSLKVRGSYGKVGNDQIGNQRFLFLNTVRTEGQAYPFGPDQQLYYGMEEDQIGNPNVTWESAWKENLGLDINLFNNQLTIQVDAFNEHRKGILLPRQTVPFVTGFYPWSIPYGNIGEVKNKGIDGLIELRHTSKSGFLYSLRGNFTFAKNTVLENDEPEQRFSYMSTKGQPLGQYVGFVADGLFENQKDIDISPRQSFGNPRPGDVKYKDINGDGVIDSYDRIPVGFPRLPQMTFGFGGTIAYKSFDVSLYFTGAARTSIYLSGVSMWPFYDGIGANNVLTEYYDNRWTPENKDARYPAIDVGNNPNNFINSTLWMKNGNYLRLRNAEIGYTLPVRLTQKAGISSLRFFVNGMNLVTWDYIKIIDPESNDGTGGYPLQRSLNVGLQIDFK